MTKPAAITPAWYAVILLLLDTVPPTSCGADGLRVQDVDAGTGNGDAEEYQP